MKKRSRIFDKNYAPYGTYKGARGNPDEWAHAFKERMSYEQIDKILGTDTPWAILGIKPGATQAEIKVAYRKRAQETHPDVNPTKDRLEFQKVQAAYEKLTVKRKFKRKN